jgi:deazaflavin-dependent oxidoreductase (nitroreductase family)
MGARLVPVHIRCEAMPRNAFQRLVVRAAGTKPGARVFAGTAQHADRVVHRATRGRATLSSWASGLPVVMLTTTGRRSGRQITTPIVAVPEADALVLVGSNFGQAHHPAWVHNLRADSRARVDGRKVQAEEIEGPERERLLMLATEVYPGFPAYVQRAAPRRIAVMRLR